MKRLPVFMAVTLLLAAVSAIARAENCRNQSEPSSFSAMGSRNCRNPTSDSPSAPVSDSGGFRRLDGYTIAVNGMAVPRGAIGFQNDGRRFRWVFGNNRSNGDNRCRRCRQSQSGSHSGGGGQGGSCGGGSGGGLANPGGGRPTTPVEGGGGLGSPTSPRPGGSAGGGSANPGGGSGSGVSGPSGPLVRAGVGGNPGFQYSVRGPSISEGCQATLVSASNGICVAATASHCLQAGAQRSNGQQDRNIFRTSPDTSPNAANEVCESSVRQDGAIIGSAEIEMADFGRVTAMLFVNPEWLSGSRSEDSAAFTFRCPNGAGNVPVVPLSDTPLQNGETVQYGKVMGGREGLYNGYVWRDANVVGINYRGIGEAQESIMQNRDVAIQRGDSGGGVYRRRADRTFELVGMLSTSDDIRRNLPLGNYATNRSLDFVRCVIGSAR